MNRPKTDKTIDAELLKNGFKYYKDWKYGPMCGWETSVERYNLKLYKHEFGYYVAIVSHSSGRNEITPLGSSNNAKDIIALRDALKKMW